MDFETLLEQERLTLTELLEGIGRGKLSSLERHSASEEGEEETDEIEEEAERMRKEMEKENKKTEEIANSHAPRKKVSALNDLNNQLISQRLNRREKRNVQTKYGHR